MKSTRLTALFTATVLGLSCGLAACGDDDGGGSNTQVEHGRLENVGGIDVLWLYGTREEMGYAEGALMCGRIRDMFRDYVLDFAAPRAGYDYDLLQLMVTQAYEIPADDARELQAVMQGAQENCPAEDLIVESPNLEPSAGGSRELTYEDLVLSHALADWACSSLTVWGEASATGGTLHARNLDFLLDPGGVFLQQHIIKVYRDADHGNATWVSVSVPGLIGCISCFNEEGSGITMHNVEGLEAADGAVPRMLAARAAIVASVGSANPVDAAEGALEACPQQVGNNLHMSFHCEGSNCPGGVVFEYDGLMTHADGMATVRAPGDATDLDTTDGIVCTNHYVKRTAPETTGGSAERYQALVDGVNAAVGSGGLTVEGALALMQETSDINVGSPTVHTVIMDTASMTLRLYVQQVAETEAPYTTPYILDLNTLFNSFPE